MNPPYAQPLIQQFVDKLLASPDVTGYLVACQLARDVVRWTWLNLVLAVLGLVTSDGQRNRYSTARGPVLPSCTVEENFRISP